MTKNLLPRLEFLSQLVVGSPVRYGAVTAVPVFSPGGMARADSRLAADAIADSLEIHEATSSGVVGMLEARNRERVPIESAEPPCAGPSPTLSQRANRRLDELASRDAAKLEVSPRGLRLIEALTLLIARPTRREDEAARAKSVR